MNLKKKKNIKFSLKKYKGWKQVLYLKKNIKILPKRIKKKLLSVLRVLKLIKLRNLRKSKKKKIIKLKHKYKKPYYKRKLFKKLQTFLYLSSKELNIIYKITKHYSILKILRLKNIKTWKYLYKDYIQYFFGISRKTFSKLLKYSVYKKKGFLSIFKFLTNQLNFFYIFNFIKIFTNKIFKLKLLYNNLIYSVKDTIKLKSLYKTNLSSILILYSKKFFKFRLEKKIAKFRYWFFKKSYRFRRWQKITIRKYLKILKLFYFIKLKKQFSYNLYYNKYFFFNLYFNKNISKKFTFFFFPKNLVYQKNLINFNFNKKYYLRNIILKKKFFFYIFKFKHYKKYNIFYSSWYMWRKKHIFLFKNLQKKIKKYFKNYKKNSWRFHVFSLNFNNFLFKKQQQKFKEIFLKFCKKIFIINSNIKKKDRIKKDLYWIFAIIKIWFNGILQNLIYRSGLIPSNLKKKLYKLSKLSKLFSNFNNSKNLHQDLVKSKKHFAKDLKFLKIYSLFPIWYKFVKFRTKFEPYKDNLQIKKKIIVNKKFYLIINLLGKLFQNKFFSKNYRIEILYNFLWNLFKISFIKNLKIKKFLYRKLCAKKQRSVFKKFKSIGYNKYVRFKICECPLEWINNSSEYKKKHI